MFMLRLSVSGVMYYLVEIVDSISPELRTHWALPGNKLQTYPKEESAMRDFFQIYSKAIHRLEFHQWDDSEAKIAKEEGEVYLPPEIRGTDFEFHVVDLRDMAIRRTWHIVRS